ncbi:hypothetical protein [Actinoplanes sp. NPDC051411]|jgi:hypothetical protein|uniref:hypothetical protein n=1 Tax=Actinoplanes sp. NPDC051411 TaxID=3155522 RepID=UPI0034301D89
MASNGSLTTPRLALGISLLVAGLGILIQYLVGVPGFPKIPPGPIILGVAGVLVLAFPRYRWLLFIGLLAALFVTVGGLIEGSVWGRLGDPGKFDVWIGVFLQWVGQAAALVSAVMALTREYRKTPALR